MSAPFLKLIPAQPGWRVARVWAGDDDKPELSYEEVIAWCELEEDPCAIVPIQRDGWGEQSITPLDGEDDFLAILEPGETVDPADTIWQCRIRGVLARQAENEQQRESLRAQRAASKK
jgi:hypothetical protein